MLRHDGYHILGLDDIPCMEKRKPMSAIDLSARLSFLRLDSARRAALAEAWRVVKPRMDEVLDAF
jgi:hypothetical protein